MAEHIPSHLYPPITIHRITHPNRWYAFPIFGFVIKTILLIPQFLQLLILGIAAFFMVALINPFVVLFTGNYWNPAYQLTSGMMRLGVKIAFFLYGLTNTYPGFDFTIHDDYKVEIHKPQHPNRLFAIPLFGFLVRAILLIPFLLYEGVIRTAAYFGAIGASFPVLYKGYYPESSYEIARDSVRLNIAQSMYVAGLSDTYPSFWISMNHKTIKIILIVLSVLYSLINFGNSVNQDYKRSYDQEQLNRQMQQKMMDNYNNYNPSDS